MLTIGFVPKEIAVALTVWLTLLYLQGVSLGSSKRIMLFFALLGVFANFYPPAFFHYAVVMLTVEVFRRRAIAKEHILYGFIFLAAAPLALYDIFIRAADFAPPVLAIIIEQYGAPLQSLSYLLVHYLRKQIIYIVLIGVLWYLYRRVYKKEYSPLMRVWYAIWWSTLLWSLVGVAIEVFAPLYMKYMLSRISVWFYLASMLIVAQTSFELWLARFGRSALRLAGFSLLLLIVLLGQTSIKSVYSGIERYVRAADDYKEYLAVAVELKKTVPPPSLVLANPDANAHTLRTYGGVGVYVAAKDGIVSLFDGAAATLWRNRYAEVQQAFRSRDFATIEAYARAHDLQYFFFNLRDFDRGTDALLKKAVLRAGPYGLADLRKP